MTTINTVYYSCTLLRTYLPYYESNIYENMDGGEQFLIFACVAASYSRGSQFPDFLTSSQFVSFFF